MVLKSDKSVLRFLYGLIIIVKIAVTFIVLKLKKNIFNLNQNLKKI